MEQYARVKNGDKVGRKTSYGTRICQQNKARNQEFVMICSYVLEPLSWIGYFRFNVFNYVFHI